MTPKGPRRTWLAGIGVGIGIALVYLVARGVPSGHATSEHPAAEQGVGSGLSIDWSSPLPHSIVVPEASVAQDVAFTPVTPSGGLGTPISVFVSDPSEFRASDRSIAYLFNSDQNGVFVIFEGVVPSLTQTALESRVQLNNPSPQPGETVFTDATFSLVSLQGGGTAVLEIAKSDGPNSIEWLVSGVDITVMGPSSTFTSDRAVAVANSFS